MAHASVPADTDPRTYAILIERWRSMDISERVGLINQLCFDVEQLARADIIAQHPRFTETGICHELARRRFGLELADAAYGGPLAYE
jgi:hypothetical protein